jgi:hypothetical protein
MAITILLEEFVSEQELTVKDGQKGPVGETLSGQRSRPAVVERIMTSVLSRAIFLHRNPIRLSKQ